MMPAHKRLFFAFLAAAAAAWLVHAPVAKAMTREAEVKAAYIYKFTSFVHWPPDAFPSQGAPVQVCVLGRKDILSLLEALTRQVAAGQRPIRTLGGSARSLESVACHVLFVGESGLGGHTVLSAHKGSVLTISDRSAGSVGGVIEFVPRGDTVRFVIHKTEASRRRLELSSKLFGVAEEVLP